MPYYSSTLVKNDLGITDSSQDTNITNWGTDADAWVDEEIHEVSQKDPLINALPKLPLSTAPQIVKNASNYYVKMKYFEYIRDYPSAETMKKSAEKSIRDYIERLRSDAVIYGTVIGDKSSSLRSSYLDTLL